MKLFWIISLIFSFSCSSSTNLMSGKSGGKSALKRISKSDLKERKKQVQSEIAVAQIIKLESNSLNFVQKTDPFYEHLKLNETIKIRRSAKAKTEYETIEIWAVQIASLIDEANADRLKSEIETKFDYPVRKLFENNIFKIRIGSYTHRNDADQLSFDLKKEGYSGVWVTKDKIEQVKSNHIQSSKKTGKFFYLQLGNFSSELYAKQFKKDLKSKMNHKIYIKRLNGFYKVLIGKLKNKSDLNSIRFELQSINYKSFIIEL